MIASFGSQTVGFVTVTESGEPGYLGLKTKTKVVVKVSGCHFRPANATEVDGQTDVATEVWKLTAPPAAAVLAAKSTGEIVYDGTDNPQLPSDLNELFRIDGRIQPKFDLDAVHHVTVMCKRQVG